MIEKWQIALKQWDKWEQSITQSRENIQNKYGAIADLLTSVKFSKDLKGEDLNPIIQIDKNDAENTIWDIVTEIRQFSGQFISQYLYIHAHNIGYLDRNDAAIRWPVVWLPGRGTKTR